MPSTFGAAFTVPYHDNLAVSSEAPNEMRLGRPHVTGAKSRSDLQCNACIPRHRPGICSFVVLYICTDVVRSLPEQPLMRYSPPSPGGVYPYARSI